jgi:hypothetical protein
MAQLKNLVFDRQRAEAELGELRSLLTVRGTGDLREASNILPFFATHEQLCALMGMYNLNIMNYGEIHVAREFSIFGDHKADLVIGDRNNKQFCFVEFEDATSTSIFKKAGRKAAAEWSARYDHGFSQLVDWILWIENNKGTAAHTARFGAPSIQFVMLMVIGRDRDLADESLRQRFEWRNDSVVVASKKVHCITYDKLYKDLAERLKIFDR